MIPTISFAVGPAEAGHTLAKVLRSRLHEYQPSWSQVRAWIEQRHVRVGDAVCSDPARRLSEQEQVCLDAKPKPLPKSAQPDGLVIRHLDDHVVVVEKPAGINTVRHPSELAWSDRRRSLDPTLQDVVQWAIARQRHRPARSLPPLRIVHRLDKETSGLLVFARSPLAERGLGLQFRKHTVIRRYLAVVPGTLRGQTVRSYLVRDRGDGRRGSTRLPGVGKLAITHVEPVETLPEYTLLSCRLETGRTHQIRIHLAELGHPVCGDKVYCRRPDGTQTADASGAVRLALHATELGFDHPVTGEPLHWTMPMPADLQKLVDRLRGQSLTSSIHSS